MSACFHFWLRRTCAHASVSLHHYITILGPLPTRVAESEVTFIPEGGLVCVVTLLFTSCALLRHSDWFSDSGSHKEAAVGMCIDWSWCCLFDLGSCACCLWTFAFARSRSSEFRSSSSSRSRDGRGRRGRGRGERERSPSPTRSRAREFGALTMTYFRMPLRELRRANNAGATDTGSNNTQHGQQC